MKYKKEQKIYRKKCRKDRKNAWHRYIDGIGSAKEITKLNRILNKRETDLITVFDTETGSTEVGEETLKVLLDTHFPSATQVPHRKYTSKNAVERATISNSFKDWINICLLYTSPSPRD